jgi:Domain of unknown function (DUF4349)
MTGPETAELEAVDAALAGRPVAPEHAEIAEIALLLRDDRPQPTLSWGTQLDRRVEQGFPKRRRRRPSFGWIRPFAPAAGVLATLAIIVLIAVNVEPGSDEEASSGSAGVTVDESGGGSSASEEMSGAQEQSDDAGAGSVAPDPALAPQQGGDPRSDDRTRRHVERSASLTVAAGRDEVDRVADGVGRVASSLGGFVASSSIDSRSGGILDLRVPSARLDDAIARISRLGDVRRLQRDARDITASVVSARSRLNDARAERTSLLRQLEDAVTVNETESIRARLRIVSREIAAARSSLRSRTNRAQYANVSVQVTASGRAPSDDGGAWTPGDAFDDAVRVLEVIAGVLVIVAAILGPIALLALLAWGGHRGLRRRRRERALDIA